MKRACLILITCAVLALPVATVAQNSPPKKGGEPATHNQNSQNNQANSPIAPAHTKNGIPVQSPPTEERNQTIHSDNTEPDRWARFSEFIAAIATVALAIIGFAGVRAALETLRHMRESSESQLRAYVCISVALLKFYDSNQFEAQVTFKNCGQTPAYKVDHRILTWIGEANAPYASFPQPTNLAVRDTDAMLGPDQTLTLTRMRDSWSNIPEGPLGTPKKNVYVYGVFRYEDAFKKDRFTRFCLVWGGVNGGRKTVRNGEEMGVFQTYPDGNDAN